MEERTRVRFTADKLGVLDAPGDTKFVGTVNKGDEGLYVRTFDELPETDWHLIEVDLRGHAFYVPVHSSQFEAV